MSLVNINWTPNKKELRQFGLTLIIGFSFIGLFFYFFYDKEIIAYACWLFGFTAGLLGLTGFKLALPVYWAWMFIAFIMGNIMSRLILAIIFYVMVTPISLIMKILRRDRLHLKKPTNSSYWLEENHVNKNESQYERQF